MLIKNGLKKKKKRMGSIGYTNENPITKHAWHLHSGSCSFLFASYFLLTFAFTYINVVDVVFGNWLICDSLFLNHENNSIIFHGGGGYINVSRAAQKSVHVGCTWAQSDRSMGVWVGHLLARSLILLKRISKGSLWHFLLCICFKLDIVLSVCEC